MEYRNSKNEIRGDKKYLSKAKGVCKGGSIRVNCVPISPSQCSVSVSIFPRNLSELTRVSDQKKDPPSSLDLSLIILVSALHVTED